MARKFKIQLRRDTAANWTSANPTLAAGECGFETDTGSLKIGDGSTAWVSLGYATGGSGAPTGADYLVGTANGGLSAEIVVGTTPGGELGGTWASPTVDATHSGSAHHDAVTVGTGLDVTGQLVELDLSEVAAGGELGGFMDAPTVDATHAGSTHIALSASEPGVVSTTSSGTAGSGSAASKDDHSHDLGFDDATADPAAVSTSAADGTATSAARKDHVHAHEAAHLAHDTLWDAAGDLVIGTGADTAAKLGITVPAANILNVLGVVNGETTATWKSVHDGTAPVALGVAAAGTALTAAHRDHVHPTTGLVTTTMEVTGGGGDVTISTTYADLLSTTVAGLAADNQIIVELDVLLLNNSGGARTYTVTLDLDGVLVEVTDGATIAASATNHAHFQFRGNADIRASNLAYLHASSLRFGPSAANTATTMAGLADVRGAWNSTTNDLTGSTVVKVKMKSSVDTVTQTARVLGWQVRVI